MSYSDSVVSWHDLKIGRVPVVDIFHRVYVIIYVWNVMQVYVLEEWIRNNCETSGWQKSGRVEHQEYDKIFKKGNFIGNVTVWI